MKKFPILSKIKALNDSLANIVKNTGDVSVTTDANGNANLSSLLPQGAVPIFAAGSGGVLTNGSNLLSYGLVPFLIGDPRKSQTISIRIYYLII